ncbi:MAG: integrase [Phycisphaerae bacterium]|nr:MAG: integrase [Phycisphaerae bacterium]
MKQFVAWARVSSQRQKNEGFSLDDQESRLREFARRLGGSVVKLFKLAETASKREERQSFREFTAYVKQNHRRLAGMLFVKVDRAARNLRDWADLEALSETTGVPLFFPDQPTGETPAGRMQRRMSAVFASYQTDQQATDIRAGQRRRIESGLPLGRQYGLRLVRVNGRSIVEHDPIQAPKVRRIFELFAYGPHTLQTLADTLARQGIIYTDRQPRFTKSTLHRILHNKIYVGKVQYQGVWYDGSFEPLIDLATFERVRERFGTDFKVYHQPQLTFAGGLITCAHCGRVVTGEHKIKKSPDGTTRDYYYYRCSGYATEGHPKHRLSEHQIDEQLLAFFATIKLDAETQAWFVEVIKARAKSGQADNKQRRIDLLRQHDQLTAKMQSVLDLRIEGEITQEEFAAKRAQMQDRQSAIRLQLECLDRDNDEVADLAIKAFELSQSLAEKWVVADYNAKRTILSIMLETVRLNFGNLEFTPRKTIQFAAGTKASSR